MTVLGNAHAVKDAGRLCAGIEPGRLDQILRGHAGDLLGLVAQGIGRQGLRTGCLPFPEDRANECTDLFLVFGPRRLPELSRKAGALIRELRTYTAHDGLELSGWLYRAPGVEGPGPMVLSFHGGPEGQARPFFRASFQALLARGISIFDPNVRGSSGFGKTFVNLDNGALRFDGIRDIESTVKFVTGAGVADPERIGIMGGSYGGYMVMAGLAWYPEMFAAGANLFGVVNFETFFAQTEPWMAAISTLEYGDPETQADLLRDLSPIHKVDRVKAPTIVLHGANDTNVPVVEAEQVVASLEERGVPVEYVLFPDEGHGWRKTKNRIASDVAIVRWFEEHL